MTYPAEKIQSIEVEPETWLSRYGDALFRYAVSRVRNTAVAEDLVQETLLSALSGVDTFKGNSTEKTWLTGILRHKVLDYFRQSVREEQLTGDWLDSSTDDSVFDEEGSWIASVGAWTSPEKSLTQSQFWQVFNGCVDNLPERLRTPFALRDLDGLNTDSVLEILDISTKNNLWVMLSRARQRVRRCMQIQWFENE